MATDNERAQAVFHEALAKSDDAERRDYLDHACADDPALRQQIDRLLAAHHAASAAFLPLPDTAAAAPRPDAAPGTVIGRYKLLQQSGEGGFGVVFMAEQEYPVRRRVALKIIKQGMDTRQVIARFEAERQALAMMDHPNVAKVLDAGATDSGRPYFVMELVGGKSITDYCDQNNLSIEKRLKLFVEVCHAVQHAHQKGLIHRDIKPSNVLVSTQDDRPHAKVIDFGIAKATQARLTERTLFTEFAAMVGTPQYMSPEQAESSLDIDTRSDVYSLGVLLYELLTGATPFDPRDLRAKAFGEIQRIIREVDPPTPSSRLATLQTLPSVAASRSTEPRKLGAAVRGEMDWIVMRCLEKNRAHRYDSAAALAADIAHHLANEPVSAGKPSRAHRLAKFVRRNKGAVIATAAVATALIIGLIGTTIGLIGESRRRVIAERERSQAQFGLASSMASSGALAGAEDLFRKSLLNKSVETTDDRQQAAYTRLRMATILFRQAKTAEAGEVYGQALTEYRGLFPPDDPNIAGALYLGGVLARDSDMFRANLGAANYPKAEPYFRQALEIRRKQAPPDHIAWYETAFALGNTLLNMGRFAEATGLYQEARAQLELAPQKAKVESTNVLWELALALLSQGRMAEASETLLEARRVIGDSKLTWREDSTLATLYSIWDRREPGKGYDRKAKEWESVKIQNSPFFRDALAAPASSPTTRTARR